MSDTTIRGRYNYRSPFWPILLIGVGVIWLLGNLRIIAPVGLITLAQLWPLLLIAIGLDLIFGRSHPLVGALIGLGVVGLAAAIMVAAPMLGLNTSSQMKTGHYTTPVGNATSAQVSINHPAGDMTVGALADSNALFDANLSYVGEIDFSAEGDNSKTVRLQQRGGFNSWPFGLSGDLLRWDIGLNPKVPADLHVQTSSGNVTLNLSSLKLKALTIDTSSGDVRATLPASPETVNVNIRSSSGDIQVTAPNNADVNSTLNMSSGSVTYDVPDNAGVQVNVRSISSGDVNVPGNYTRTATNGRKGGTWESPNYANAERKIVITVDHISSGNVNVR